MRILLTNDDGIHAPGLRCAARALIERGHAVTVVAPMTEQSAVGHAVTLRSPLRAKRIAENGFTGFAVEGTPVDCVKLALAHLLPAAPDCVVSGINNGANVGVDILYSGTVSAATEGALTGIPSFAVSMDNFHPDDLLPQARSFALLMEWQGWQALPARRVINVNYPDRKMEAVSGIRLCPQTSAVYRDKYHERRDPRGGVYYWLSGEIPKEDLHPASDRALLTEGYVTITPLCFEFTDHASMSGLAGLEESDFFSSAPPGRTENP